MYAGAFGCWPVCVRWLSSWLEGLKVCKRAGPGLREGVCVFAGGDMQAFGAAFRVGGMRVRCFPKGAMCLTTCAQMRMPPVALQAPLFSAFWLPRPVDGLPTGGGGSRGPLGLMMVLFLMMPACVEVGGRCQSWSAQMQHDVLVVYHACTQRRVLQTFFSRNTWRL